MYIVDRAYREAVSQVVGRVLKGVFPVGTGLIMDGLANREHGDVGGARDRREPASLSL